MKRETRKTILQYAAIAAAGFLLAYILVALFVFPNDGVADGVKVPAVVGMRYDAAVRRLAAIGLKGSLGESRVSASSPQSTVLAQHPAAGLDALRGATIALDVSAGQERATVPSVVGMTQDDAVNELRRIGLTLGQITEQPADDPRGTVLQLRPDAGQIVPSGTTIDFVISGGPAELFMPDVLGRDGTEAKIMLDQLGVTLAPFEYDSISNLPRGSVISQSPSAGASLPQGSSVVLRIAGKP
ncbi:MAG: PASTA domain-containing protein [Gemmatimonadaceae bacterium]